MITHDTVRDAFTYHAPSPEQVEKITQLRELAIAFAEGICDLVPQGADQQAAVRKVHEALMTGNKGIVLEGKW